MNCPEIQELLSTYHDGELADEKRSRVSDHLVGCSVCARTLAGFEKLSTLAGAFSTPAPPAQMWGQIAQQLDQQAGCREAMAGAANQNHRPLFSVVRLIALTATVFVAVGIGTLTYQSWFTDGLHGQFAAEFEHYLETFRSDPDAAQQILLTKYDNRSVGPDQAIEQVGYRPAIANGLPAGYAIESTHVMQMPCCTCMHSTCKRRDGSTLAIFEHDDDSCKAKHCCLIEVDDQIASSWKRGTRHITLIGVQDDIEARNMIAWLDEKRDPTQN